jgi:membrane fusion protein, multidrug efflux system
MYKDAPASESDWDKEAGPRSGGAANPRRDIMTLRAPARETPPAAERPVETPDRPAEEPERQAEPAEKEAKPGQQPVAKEEKPDEKPRKGFLRRRPVLAPVGLIALLLAAAAGYLYWDHTSHFESTDDAFIAARQFAIAPQVAGYVKAVPVTDNQHVN